MLNVNELENRWSRYKIKSYIPHAAITLSLVVISVLTSFIMDTDTTDNNVVAKVEIAVKQEPQAVTKAIVVKNSVAKKDPQNTYAKDAKGVILSPSLGFMSNMKHSTIYSGNKITPTLNNQNISSKTDEVEIVMQETEEELVEEEVVKKTPIKIERKNSKDSLKDVIQRFKKTNNPALSLFIAKKFYSLGEYHKAYNYALITNELNDKIDASWILFVKSLMKLNEKDEAIKTLKDYINHSHSNQAKILLEDIGSGKFK